MYKTRAMILAVPCCSSQSFSLHPDLIQPASNCDISSQQSFLPVSPFAQFASLSDLSLFTTPLTGWCFGRPHLDLGCSDCIPLGCDILIAALQQQTASSRTKFRDHGTTLRTVASSTETTFSSLCLSILISSAIATLYRHPMTSQGRNPLLHSPPSIPSGRALG